MRCLTLLSLALLLQIGCSGPDEGKPADSGATTPDTDPPTDDDPVDTDAPPTDDTDAPAGSTFVAGQYLIEDLALYEDADVDGDGTVDNNLANALNLVDFLMPAEDLSVASFNAMLASGLHPMNVILLDAAQDNGVLTVGLLYAESTATGVRIDETSMDENGDPLIQFVGGFTSQTAFDAGPVDMALPVTFSVADGPVQIALVDVRLAGTMSAGLTEGDMTAVVPITVIVEDIVDPLIPVDGYDIDGDGVNETKQEILDLVWSIAPSAGDVDLGNGETGVSATFSFFGVPKAF